MIKNNLIKFYILSLVIVISDQITKIIVKFKMDYGSSIDVIGDFLKFTYVENPGMAFGLDFGHTSKFFLSLFSIIASIGLAIYLYKVKEESNLYKLSIALILGGAFGNLIDRVFYGVLFQDLPLMYGRVIDFVNVEFFDFTIFGNTYTRWPIFNIADAAVSVGVVFLIFSGHKSTKANQVVDENNDENVIKEQVNDDVLVASEQGDVNYDKQNDNRKDL